MIEGFLGFEIFDFGISFGQENFGKYFWGSLIYVGYFGVFKTIWRFVIDPVFRPLLEIFMAWKFGVGFFGGWILVQGFWGVLFEALGISWGVLFLPPFDHPCHLKSGVPPPPTLAREPINMFCHFCARWKISIILRSTLRKCTCPWNMCVQTIFPIPLIILKTGHLSFVKIT